MSASSLCRLQGTLPGLRGRTNLLASVANIRIPPKPPVIENTRMPEKFRLPMVPKVPHQFGTEATKVPKGAKDQWMCMGEETVHNELILKQFAIIATTGGYMSSMNFEQVRKVGYQHLKGNISPGPSPYQFC